MDISNTTTSTTTNNNDNNDDNNNDTIRRDPEHPAVRQVRGSLPTRVCPRRRGLCSAKKRSIGVGSPELAAPSPKREYRD